MVISLGEIANGSVCTTCFQGEVLTISCILGMQQEKRTFVAVQEVLEKCVKGVAFMNRQLS